MDDIDAPSDVVVLAERVLTAFDSPFRLDAREITIRCSIGVVLAGSGGGTADDLLRDADFGFSAKSNGGLKGGCTVIDQAADIKIKCLDVTSYFQTATKATFLGNAEVNGELTRYRIVVEDNAESGSGADRFSITTDSGYSASGLLTAGNIQVHQ